MNYDKLIGELDWNIRRIFTYKDRYQEHCGDGIEYYDCKLLIDFGPFKKGRKCKKNYIDSASGGDFTMSVDGELFVPVWTHIPKKEDKISSLLQNKPIEDSESSSDVDTMDVPQWDISRFFDYTKGKESKSSNGGVIYYDRVLKMDMGIFNAYDICHICIEWSSVGQDYLMFIDCDIDGDHGELFTLKSNNVPQSEKNKIKHD